MTHEKRTTWTRTPDGISVLFEDMRSGASERRTYKTESAAKGAETRFFEGRLTIMTTTTKARQNAQNAPQSAPETAPEKIPMRPDDVTQEEFFAIVKRGAGAAARRTAARAPEVIDIYRRNREDIEQETALDVLERYNADPAPVGKDGERLNLYQVTARAANAAIHRAHGADVRTRANLSIDASDDAEDADGMQAEPAAPAEEGPEARAIARETVAEVIARTPAAYRDAAADVIRGAAAGMSSREIARATGRNYKAVQRTLTAVRAAAMA